MQRQQASAAQVSTRPQELMFRFLKNQARVQVWLNGLKWTRIEGVLAGFDDDLHMVLKDATEINIRHPHQKPKYLGETLILFHNVDVVQSDGLQTT